MAGEVLLINTRYGRKRRTKARAHRRKRARARHNPFEYAMNRRRRRHVATRASRRRHRARRNPQIPLLGNVNFNAIGAGAAGYIGTRYGTGWLLSVLPRTADPNTAPLVRIGVKAVIGIAGLPMLARMLRLRGAAGPLAIGGGIAVAVDLFETYLAKMIPIPMADYEQQVLTDYETRQLTGTEEEISTSIGGGAFGGGAFGGSAF